MAAERQWWKSGATGTLNVGPPDPGAEWVWVDLEGPDEASLRSLASRFGLDEIALEDALDAELFPRHEDFGHFLVVAMRSVAAHEDGVETTPVLYFVGRDFLATVHHEPLPGLEFVAETAQAHLPTAEGGPDRMFARLADVGSRRFEPVLDAIDRLLLDSEALALAGESGAVRALQPVRRKISELRGVIRPQRSILQALVYTDSELVGERARRRLTDVLERHARMEESLETARATANSVVELHRGAVAERANEIMKVLTVFSATLLPMTLIAGIYGMNFSNIPELDYRFGYPLTLGIMTVLGTVLWRYFVRRGFIGRPSLPNVATNATSALVRAAKKPVGTVGSLVASNLRATRKGVRTVTGRASPASRRPTAGDS